MSANIEEFACISMGGLFSGVPPLLRSSQLSRILDTQNKTLSIFCALEADDIVC